jgi:hypothetical protein
MPKGEANDRRAASAFLQKADFRSGYWLVAGSSQRQVRESAFYVIKFCLLTA